MGHVFAALRRTSSSSSSTTAPLSGIRLSFHSRSTSRRKRKSAYFQFVFDCAGDPVPHSVFICIESITFTTDRVHGSSVK